MSTADNRFSSPVSRFPFSVAGHFLEGDVTFDQIEWYTKESSFACDPPVVAYAPEPVAQSEEGRELWLKNFQEDRFIAYQHSTKEWKLARIVRRDGKDIILQPVDFNMRPFGYEVSRPLSAGEKGRAKWHFPPLSKCPRRMTAAEFRHR